MERSRSRRGRHDFVFAALIVLILCGAAMPASAAILNVPSVPYPAITDAITAAAPGDTIVVAAGMYPEQVHVTKSNLLIIGSGESTTTIQSPAALTEFFVTGSNNNFPVVFVDGATGVRISGLTVDGNNQGDANYRFIGIAFWNGGGSLQDVTVKRIMDSSFSGAQHGVGVYANNDMGGPYAVSLTDVTVDDFQKTGVALSGTGLTVVLDSVAVTGEGVTTITAQNGIQIAYGATGTVTDCSVSEVAYGGEGWVASGMLFYQGVTVDLAGSCTVTGCQAAIVYQETQGAVVGVSVTAGSVDNAEGISIRDYGYAKAGGGREPLPVSPFDEESKRSLFGAPTAITLDDVTLNGAHVAGAYGLAVWSLGDNVSADLSGSEIENWEIGVIAYEAAASGVALTATGNTIASNDLGLWTNAVASQDADKNWWGHRSGPNDPGANPGGTGDGVDGNVDYSPWYGDPPATLPMHWGTNGSIQEAVEAAAPGDTIVVAAGTYTERVVVDRALTLRGPNAGIDPNTGTRVAEAEIHTDSLNTHQAVLIQSSDVTVDGFTLYGPNGSVKDIGAVGLSGAGARTNVHVQYNRIFRTAGGADWNCDGIRMDPPSGAAASIYIEHNRIQVGTTQPEGNNDITIADHGYRMAHGDAWTVGDPDRVVIRHNDLYGHGKMYIEGIGVLIEDNDFLGIWGPIEVRGAKDVVITDNRMVNQNDIGIFAWSPLSASGAGLLSDLAISGNVITGMQLDPQNFTDEGTAVVLAGVTNATVTSNILTGNSGSGVVIGGIGYDHFYPEDVGWGGGLDAGYDPVNNVVHNNAISGNTSYGALNRTTVSLNAENNWWGDAAGPATKVGNPVSPFVDYDPWTGKEGGENIVCVPDPRNLTVAVPTNTVDVKYLGGGGGLVYGYSVSVSWDPTRVTMNGITQGDLLPTTWFFVRGTGNSRTVDCVLTGGQAGVTGPGTLFTISFTGIGYGTSPVDLTVIKVRDKDNHPLSGFFADDGEVRVDITSPVVSSVFLANLTLAHTDDYAKNTDNLRLTATVSDDFPLGTSNIKADLSALLAGGGSAVEAESLVAGVVIWRTALANVTLTSDGSKSAQVTVTDGLGNTASGSDAIIVDNTPPTKITGFDAAPHHERVALLWTNPSGLDVNYYGVLVRYDGGGTYPEYDVLGTYPAGPTGGDGEAFNQSGVVTSGNHVIATRDIYYYAAFAYDWALNYGPYDATADDRATNYWLGDVTADLTPGPPYDGLVDGKDFNELSAHYWEYSPSSPPVAPFNECDAGPTDDGSRLGIPQPDNFLDFEDLILFAMNYNVVTPTGKGSPGVCLAGRSESGRPTLGLVALGPAEVGKELTLSLSLGGNADVVKGVSLVFAYDPSVLEYVDAAASEALGAGVFFRAASPLAGSVRLDLAVLGTGEVLHGTGELARLTFRVKKEGSDEVRFAAVEVRDAENRALGAGTSDLEGNDHGPAPLVTRLSGAWPNPFNPMTTVRFDLREASRVRLDVYDAQGRLVRTLMDAPAGAGTHEAVWDGCDNNGRAAGSGVYLVRMNAGAYQATSKLVVLR